MRHDLRLDGPGFRLRPVELSDAQTILELRRDPSRSAYLHETDASVDSQIQWLTAYFDRPGDYYWAVERRSTGATEGFLGIYDVDGETAEWGRWVLRPGSLAAPESAWLVHEAGFTLLGLSALLTRTLVDNSAVVAFHARYGAETVRTLPGHAELGGVPHDAVEARVTREMWAEIGPRLHSTAQRTVALMDRSRRTPG